jgi:hypothetical protein
MHQQGHRCDIVAAQEQGFDYLCVRLWRVELLGVRPPESSVARRSASLLPIAEGVSDEFGRQQQLHAE